MHIDIVLRYYSHVRDSEGVTRRFRYLCFTHAVKRAAIELVEQEFSSTPVECEDCKSLA